MIRAALLAVTCALATIQCDLAHAAFPGRPGPIVYSKVHFDATTQGGGGLVAHGPRVGERPRQLTSNGNDREPAYSADGRWIAVVSRSELVGPALIEVMRSDGSERRPVVAAGFAPAFFPNGSEIAFVRRVDGHRHIFTVNIDGSGLRQLTRGPFDDFDPIVSPNGESIAFVSDRDRDSRRDRTDIFSIGAEGRNLRLLSDLPRSQAEPDWSPDGEKIAFAMRTGLRSHIFVVRTGGQRLWLLTGCFVTPVPCRSYHAPAFSPDGKHVVALSKGSGASGIEVFRSDGSGDFRTFEDAVGEGGEGTFLGEPTWGPRPR